MNYYNAKFFKNGVAQGREYLYKSDDEFEVGAKVDLPNRKHGEITSIADDDFVSMIRDRIGDENIGRIVGPTKEAVDDA